MIKFFNVLRTILSVILSTIIINYSLKFSLLYMFSRLNIKHVTKHNPVWIYHLHLTHGVSQPSQRFAEYGVSIPNGNPVQRR